MALTALPHPLQLTLNWQQQQGVLSVAMPDTPQPLLQHRHAQYALLLLPVKGQLQRMRQRGQRQLSGHFTVAAATAVAGEPRSDSHPAGSVFLAAGGSAAVRFH
jgi:hypothetical protein